MPDKPFPNDSATLFHTDVVDPEGRITTFCNFLLLLDGGILGITIAAFLGGRPAPAWAPYGLFAIRNGWYLLSAAMIVALTLTFFMVLSQLSVRREGHPTATFAATEPRLLNDLAWKGTAVRVLLVLAFVYSVFGIACIGYGAVQA